MKRSGPDQGCGHGGCAAAVVYRDEWRALCDDHYTAALELEGGACDGN